MTTSRVFLLLVAAQGRYPVDFAQSLLLALECQQAYGNEEINTSLQKALNAVIVALQEQCRQQLQFHLRACGVFQLIDAQQRIITMGALALPIRGRKAVNLIALGRAMTRRGFK